MPSSVAPCVLRSPPWGKKDAAGETQSLVDHCRAVATVFVALLQRPGIGSRITRLAGGKPLSDVQVARLGWIVMLHDFGKANWGFQRRDEPGFPVIGHVAPIAGMPPALGDLIARRLMPWGAPGPVLDWFHAALSHHGKPWTDPQVANPNALPRYGKYWRPLGSYDPVAEVRRLMAEADAQFPAARGAAPPLPLTPPLVHALAGLTILADWIASSGWLATPPPDGLEAWAAGWLDRIGLDPAPWRMDLPEPPDFAATFGFPPNPAQSAFAAAPSALAILESETGSGKTEAALWRFLARFRAGAVDGLYFALPSRTAAVQLHRRLEKLASTLWPGRPSPVVLAVPGYLDEAGPGQLPDARDAVDQAEGDARGPARWASEHPKRYFAGLISVGTVDQALLSVLRVKHAALRSAALMRLMLVLDEVHASDAYMSRLTEELLADHLAAGGEAILLSATLGARARSRHAAIGRLGNLADADLPPLADAIAAPYPAITTTDAPVPDAVPAAGPGKVVTVSVAPLIDDAAAIAARALAVAEAGAKVLVVRNTVAGAIAVQQALEAAAGADSPLLFRVNGIATLHHGRFAREDRRLLDAAVETAAGKHRPAGGCVIVGTQTLEISLDIDADFLISDLCPMDVLLQRIGRLHRHRAEPDGRLRQRPESCRDAGVLVLTPAADLSTLLAPGRRGQARHGLGPIQRDGRTSGVYPDVLVLEATRRLCAAGTPWPIPAMNRALVEGATHPEALAALIEALPADQRPLWQTHQGATMGTGMADKSLAAGAVLDRDQPFMAPVNQILPEEHIATRLGDDSLLVTLAEAVPGPFGTPVRRLVSPGWWGLDPTAAASATLADGVLRIGDAALPYDRYGLRRA